MKIFGIDFTFGADPEVFTSKNNEFFPVFDILPGSKENPYRVENGYVQPDGLAAEFNIDPVETPEMFEQRINQVSDILKNMVGSDFMKSCTVDFSEEEIMAYPFHVTRLGCDRDWNAYTGTFNPRPNANLPMRTAGGHLHIGGFGQKKYREKSYIDTCASLTKHLDATIGVYSLLWDEDTRRREMYGRAGAFRPKPYGVEYRTLSNAWLFKPGLPSWLATQMGEAIKRQFMREEHDDVVEHIINNSDVKNEFFKRDNVKDTVEELRGILAA